MLIHLSRLKWALRKISLPIDAKSLVLDVGSGSNPYPRADILLDRLTGAEHRCGQSMMIDRPTIFADAARMPFKDKAFDFVIASHILEHMSDPALFLQEMQRVAKAGYIETPNAIFERLSPYNIHCTEVLEINGVLHIHKKKHAIEDSYLGTKNILSDTTPWGKLMFKSPDLFHVRYVWRNSIKYEIDNPSDSCEWIKKINTSSEFGEIKHTCLERNAGWRDYGLAIANLWHGFRRKSRLRDFSLIDLLKCPSCGASNFKSFKQSLYCNSCGVEYPYRYGVPDFTDI